MYRFPQLKILIENPPEDSKRYLCAGVSEEEALSLLVNPATGLPIYLPNNPRAVQVFKTMLDMELPSSEWESLHKQPVEEQRESVLDLLLNTKNTILSKL